MSALLQHNAQPPSMSARALEAVLRERTDIFATARSVLAIAPDAALDAVLSGLTHLRYRRAHAVAAAGHHVVAGTIDVAIIDATAIGASQRPLRELARLMRPGGRLVASVLAVDASALILWLAAAGFFTARVHDDDVTILIAVRGVFATRR